MIWLAWQFRPVGSQLPTGDIDHVPRMNECMKRSPLSRLSLVSLNVVIAPHSVSETCKPSQELGSCVPTSFFRVFGTSLIKFKDSEHQRVLPSVQKYRGLARLIVKE